MRNDAIGIFWQDLPRVGGKNKVARVMPPIPDTGWTPPTEFPRLEAAKALSIDVETYDPELLVNGPGWARHRGHICGLAVGTEDGGRWYFPMRHTVEKDQNLDPEAVLAWARDTLGDPRQPKIGANLPYDVGWLREEGVEVRGQLLDVQYAEALLREGGTVNLDDLGMRYLNIPKASALLYEWCHSYYGGSATDQRANIYRSPPRLVGPYAEGDVDLPFRVLELQWPLLAQQGLLDLFLMECDLIPLMIEMRFAGVSVDIPQAERLRESLIKEAQVVDDQIRHLVGFEVNINAAESLARAFDSLGLTYGFTKKSKKPSFTATFLDSVEHPIGDLIRKKRALDKLRGTFVESYILNSHVDGKVYGQFHQLRGDKNGARSGRFSSSNPNLQNIPFRTELGKQVRRIFIPDPGHRRWIKSDYNQIEYRGLAHYAVGPGSDEVRARYQQDPRTDFHKLAHGLILAATGQDLQRPDVKNMNFGVAYGMGEAAMAKRLGLAMNIAKRLMQSFHDGAPFLKETMNACMIEAQRLGYITTILGRRSRFDLWVPSDYESRKTSKPLPFELAVQRYANPQRAYLHKALNRRLQGSAADLIKMAMLKCWKDGLFAVTGVPRLTVHDELDFSDPGGTVVEEAFKEVIHVMQTAIPFRVPILVETEYGPNWGDVEKPKKVA